MKKWKYLLIYIGIITSLFSICIFFYVKADDSSSVEAPDMVYSDQDIMAMVTERITYEREYLRYYQNEKEFSQFACSSAFTVNGVTGEVIEQRENDENGMWTYSEDFLN